MSVSIINATPISQATKAFVITPNDGADLAFLGCSIYVGVSGNLSVVPAESTDGAAVTFENHPVGYAPILVRRVFSTNTTASGILGLYNGSGTKTQ